MTDSASNENVTASEQPSCQSAAVTPLSPTSIASEDQLLSPTSPSAENTNENPTKSTGKDLWEKVKKGAKKGFEIGESIGGWVAWIIGIEDNHFIDELTDRQYHDMIQQEKEEARKKEGSAELATLEQGELSHHAQENVSPNSEEKSETMQQANEATQV